MFKYRFGTGVPKKVYLHWFLLCFLSGNVNAGGFLACGRFVTHITGFATLFAVSLSVGQWKRALEILSVPFFFVLGAAVSGCLVDRQIILAKEPQYKWVMGLVSFCLILVAVGGHLDWFESFGETLRIQEDYFLLILLCLASGLQNAAVSTASSSTVRTTHLTGISTDLGVGCVRAWVSRGNAEKFSSEIEVNHLRIGSIISFIFGSVVGAALFIRAQYLGFLVPAALALYTTIIAQNLQVSSGGVSIFSADTGTKS